MYLDSEVSKQEARLFLAYERIKNNEELLDQFDIDIETVLNEYQIFPYDFPSVYALVDAIGVKPLSREALLGIYRQGFTESTLSSATNKYNYALKNQSEVDSAIDSLKSRRSSGVEVDSLIKDTGYPSSLSVGAVKMTSLNTREALFDETKKMEHAIMHFLSKFKAGEWIAYQIEGPGDERSTVAYDITDDESISVDTHKAYRNAEPEKVHVDAAQAAIGLLANAKSVDKTHENNAIATP